jgi:glyoxylase-like metal-dependent hydrolase (beta-lactamase superfamily II)
MRSARTRRRPRGSPRWYSWTELTASLGNLGAYRFEWLLPGHGWPVHLPADEMNRRLLALVERMPQM